MIGDLEGRNKEWCRGRLNSIWYAGGICMHMYSTLQLHLLCDSEHYYFFKRAYGYSIDRYDGGLTPLSGLCSLQDERLQLGSWRCTSLSSCRVSSSCARVVSVSETCCVLFRQQAYPSSESGSEILIDLDFCHMVQRERYVGVHEMTMVRLALITAYKMLFVV